VNPADGARAAAERTARESYGKLVAYLAKRCGNVHAAEDALADALASALERWPNDGVPRAPDAWLLVAARHRLFDGARRERRRDVLHERLAAAGADAQHAFEAAEELEDDRLGVLFACAHPALGAGVRAPLMLQVVLGIDAARIAHAFMIAPATMSQRLVRAKHKIATAGIPLRVPPPAEWPERLDAVLAAIYAAFGEGWDDPRETDPRTRGLACEAMWLGRLLAQACPREPEALGLAALMTYANARRAARVDGSGAYVPLERQPVARWDAAALDEAENLLERAAKLGRMGRFQLEAAIQSAHVIRRRHGSPDWEAIAVLYDELLRRTRSPVVALNRAASIGRARGAVAGLAALGVLARDARMLGYQPYWATLANLAERAGHRERALDAYRRALELTTDPGVRNYLSARAGAASEG
jgi:RNA polymerase sigma-70 factor (ECF subfamily)